LSVKTKRIGVLMGGFSREREISLRSGRAVAAALKRLGYLVVEIDVGRDIAEKLVAERIEVAVIMLHGRLGEDGTIQGMLEVIGIPYSDSGPLASSVAMDKILSKTLVERAGVRTPAWREIRADVRIDRSPPPLPVVVKPNQEGSTLGVSIVRRPEEFGPALDLAASFQDPRILVEEFISGKELTVALIEGKALPVVEIVPKSGFYDYAAKYTKGMTEYIVPARISEPERATVCALSEKIFATLQLSGIARADFILSSQVPFFLEVNTIPGMTETSLVPKAAEAAGIGFDELCERLVQGASLKVGV